MYSFTFSLKLSYTSKLPVNGSIYDIPSILGPNFSYFEYPSCIKYPVIDLKHFRVEKDPPWKISENITNYAVIN